jgi:hypothetical protein
MKSFSIIYGYVSAIPFIGLALYSFYSNEADLHVKLAHMQLAYSVYLLSSFSGIHWKSAAHKNSNEQPRAPFIMNMLPAFVSVMIFFASLAVSPTWPLFCMGLLFVKIYRADRRILDPDSLPTDYFKMRLFTTALIFLCLFSTALRIKGTL